MQDKVGYNVSTGTVVRPSTELCADINFVIITFCVSYCAEHWQPLSPVFLFETQSTTCFQLYNVINSTLLVSLVYSILIKRLEWKPPQHTLWRNRDGKSKGPAVRPASPLKPTILSFYSTARDKFTNVQIMYL